MRFPVLILTICGLLVGSALWAAPITGVSIAGVSAEFTDAGWDLRAVNVVNGSGLSGTPAVHDVIAYPGGDSWQTNTSSGTGWISFDLGAPYQLSHLHVWNLNFYAPYNGRGARDVDIYTSLNGVDWVDEGQYLFQIASGLTGDLGFDVQASGWNMARYVRISILSNFGSSDNAGHVGLSEVQFFADDGAVVPEPSSWVFVIVGLAILALSQRRYRA